MQEWRARLSEYNDAAMSERGDLLVIVLQVRDAVHSEKPI